MHAYRHTCAYLRTCIYTYNIASLHSLNALIILIKFFLVIEFNPPQQKNVLYNFFILNDVNFNDLNDNKYVLEGKYSFNNSYEKLLFVNILSNNANLCNSLHVIISIFGIQIIEILKIT